MKGELRFFLSAYFLCVYFGVVGQELCQTAVGKRVFQQTLDRSQRAGSHIGTGIETLDDMLRMTNRSSQYEGREFIIAVHLNDMGNQTYAILADIVQTAYER